MVTTSTPKLEDFFGGATMGTHHYESNDREAMALSLDSSPSMYYHQDPDHEPNNQNCLNHLQQNPRQQQQQQHQHIQVQHYPCYSNFRNNEMLVGEDAKQMAQASDCSLKLPNMGDDGITGMKNWVSRNYQGNHAMEQKMLRCMVENGGESGPNISAMAYGDLQCLSLSMSPGSQSSCVTGSLQVSPSVNDSAAMETKKRGPGKVDQKQIVHRKSIDTFGQRTSQYRGVTRLLLILSLIPFFFFITIKSCLCTLVFALLFPVVFVSCLVCASDLLSFLFFFQKNCFSVPLFALDS